MKSNNLFNSRIPFSALIMALFSFMTMEAQNVPIIGDGDATISLGQQELFEVTTTTASSYSWTINGDGGEIQGSSTNRTVWVKAVADNSFTLNITLDGGASFGSKLISVDCDNPGFLMDITPPTCTTSTGAVTVNPTVSGTYEYSFDNGAWVTSNTKSGLSIGNHSVRLKDSYGCITTKTATIPGQPSPPGPPTLTSTTTTTEMCAGDRAYFYIDTPLGGDIVYRWYSPGPSGSLQFTGDSWDVQPLNVLGTRTYSVTAYNTETDCESVATDVPVYIYSMPNPSDNSPINACGTSGLTLSAQNTKSINNTVRSSMDHKWYDNPNGTGTPITHQTDSGVPSGTLATYIIVPNQTATYYVMAEYDGCESDLIPIQATYVDDTLTGGGIDTGQTICYNTSPSKITSTSDPNGGNDSFTYKWEWATSVNGSYTPINNTNVKEYTPPSNLTSDRWYRRRAFSCNDQLEAVTNASKITVNGQVSAAGVTPGERCGTGTVQLSATPGGSADEIRWYTTSTGGTHLTTGVSSNTLDLTTTSLSTDKTYYAESYDSASGCVSSSRTPVTATINPIPGLASATDPAPTCGPSVFTFSATPGSNANSIKWYTAASGGTLKHTGPSYITPTALQVGTTTYYAASYNTTSQCEDTDRKAVTATVYAVPPQNLTITQEVDATCNDPNGSFFIENYDGALYTYTVTSSTNATYTGGPSFNLPGDVYTVTATTIGSSCTSNAATVDIRNLNGPFTPTAPSLVKTDPTCATANGTFTIQSYAPGTYVYEISPDIDISGPDTNGVVSAPAGTYTVTRREGNCISDPSSIEIVAPSNPCGGCTITGVLPDPAEFSPGSDMVQLNFTGELNCTLQVIQKPDWISYNILSNSSIQLISQANGGGDRADIVQIQQDGGQMVTIDVKQEHSTNFPGNPGNDEIQIVGDGCGDVVLQRISDTDLTQNHPGETWYWQGNNPEGTSTLLGSGETYTITGQMADDNYYIRAHKNGNWSTESASVFVPYKQTPEIASVGVSNPNCEVATGTLTVNLVDNSLTGLTYSFDGGTTYQPENTKSGMPTGDHVVIVSAQGCESTSYTATVNEAPTSGCGDIVYTGNNYIYTRTYQESAAEMGISTTTEIPFFTENEDLIQQITYFDGLGRPIQQIGIDQSPNQGGNFGDLVTHMAYDDFGRMEKEYLPYATTVGNPGTFRSDALSKTTAFYSDVDDRHENTGNPFSQKDFEPSPLNRVLKQAAPGDDWAMGSDHEIEFGYEANSADEVRLFTVDLSGGNENPQLAQNGFYAANQLYKNVTKDENHKAADGKLHTTEEFTDKQGRVVLKRTYAMVSIPTPEVMEHDTYYVYDDFGNLTYVIPPKVNTADGVDQTERDELCYQYVYDYRNRLVEKKIPGKDPEYIVYNALDQPIMTQDGNQRGNNEWLFTKYDGLGRVAYTGKTSDAQNRTAIQNTVTGLTVQLWVDRQASDRNSEFTENIEIYYDNGAYPTSVDEVLTINYYDTYVDEPSGVPATIVLLDSPTNETATAHVQGLATVSKVKVLDQDPAKWIHTATYYDDKARPIYTYSENEFLATVDIVETRLDFIGKPLKTKTTHTRDTDPAQSGVEVTIVTIDNFQYDQTGRLLAQTQCIGDETLNDDCSEAGGGNTIPVDLILPLPGETNVTGTHVAGNSITATDTEILPDAELYINGSGLLGDQELIVFNEYDNLGQLKSKKVGGPASPTGGGAVGGGGLQQVDYKYNIRGWLTDINDIVSTDKLFSFSIGYNQGANPLYNGNISKTQWRTANTDSSLKSYDYTYDALNRITSAIDNTTDYNLNSVSYDKNGNITMLARNGFQNSGSFTNMDILDYDYDSGNKLTKVTDAGNDAHGFKDGTNNNDDFEYDINGNLKIDRNKGITSVTYNHLNLPEQVDFGSDNIKYVYDATGAKLKRTSSTGTETLYAGYFIYEGGIGISELQFFSHPEGYVTPDGQGGYDYVYNYVDHLGSVRLSYTDADGNGNIDPANEIIEDNAYYPFGLLMRSATSSVSPYGNSTAKRWKFKGNELDNTFNIDTYDFGARNYDPALGRWFGVDELADDYYSASPYGFVDNNPMINLEIDGRFWIRTVDDDGNVTYTAEDGDSAFSLFEQFGEQDGFNADEANFIIEHVFGENRVEDGEEFSNIDPEDSFTLLAEGSEIIEKENARDIRVVPNDSDAVETDLEEVDLGSIQKDQATLKAEDDRKALVITTEMADPLKGSKRLKKVLSGLKMSNFKKFKSTRSTNRYTYGNKIKSATTARSNTSRMKIKAQEKIRRKKFKKRLKRNARKKKSGR